MSNKNFEAVVFDMDGVIFDSERCALDCWIDLSKKYILKDIETTFMDCIGTNRSRTKEIMIEAYGENFPYENFILESSKMYHSKYDGGRLPMKKGIEDILKALKDNDKKIALASSSRKSTVYNQLKDAGIIDYFDVIICGDMVEKSKPAPDIFLKACEELHVKPKNTYGIEDSYNGVRALHNGDLHPIMVPDLLPPSDEMLCLSEAILENLIDVKNYLL